MPLPSTSPSNVRSFAPHHLLIAGFVLLNMGVGFLFHNSLNIICQSEFLILGISSFLFWSAGVGLIRKQAIKRNFLTNKQHLWLHGGMGISVSLINILLGQVLIVCCMVYLYRCPISPSFNWLNAMLTNNIGINLLCYFALCGHFSYLSISKQEVPEQSFPVPTPGLPLPRIKLSAHGMQTWIDPDQIVFIETSNNCIVIHTSSNKYVKYQSLKKFLQEHEFPFLRRTHRSYVVNIHHINSIRKNKNGDGIIHLNGDHNIKLSRNFPLTL